MRARNDAMRNGDGSSRVGLFDGVLTKVMRRLDSDRSPEAILDATLVYNQLVEGVAAINGYRRWAKLTSALAAGYSGAAQVQDASVAREHSPPLRRHVSPGISCP